jgi:2-polyprenyl-6-hydroxyphenyl methylase/3-demethylubiquinone-9 3-methyltransferase
MAAMRTAAADDDRRLKADQRARWALGDYHRIATDMLWEFGPELVEACGISAGQRVLDVAAGTGNVAIRAAEAGAQVVASDLTPENFDAGRREARARGVELEWVEADAEALPFDDDAFDVVTSSAGAIFAPRHQVVADQLLRVCRPGGTIGMITIVPAGVAGDLIEIIERYSPSPPGVLSPLEWGNEDHVRELFGDRVESLELTRKTLVLDRFSDPAELWRYLKTNHPLVVGLYQDLAGEAARIATLDRGLVEAATRWNRGGPDGPAVYETEYLLVVARKRPQPR